MIAAEIVGRGVAFDLNNDDFPVILEALTNTLLYHHSDDLEEDVPLERVESDMIELFKGDVPQSVEDFLDSLDEPWIEATEVELDL